MLYATAIIFFCFFYTALVFNPKETADNLKKSGAFVPGIRPGDQTARYIEKITLRLTLVGAVLRIFISLLLPEFLIVWKKVPNFITAAFLFADYRGGEQYVKKRSELRGFHRLTSAYIISTLQRIKRA